MKQRAWAGTRPPRATRMRATIARSSCCSARLGRPPAALGEVGRGCADLLELLLQLFRLFEIGRLELAPDLALAQAQKQFLGGFLVDALCRRPRVQLGQQRHELVGRWRARLEQVLAPPS